MQNPLLVLQNLATCVPRNLLAGLRVLVFLPVRREDFTSSWRNAILLAAFAGATWLLFDWSTAPDDAKLAMTGIALACFMALVFIGVLLFVSPAGEDGSSAVAALTALASVFPGFLLIALCASRLSDGTQLKPFVAPALTLLGAIYLYRVLRIVLGGAALVTVTSAVIVTGVTWAVFEQTVKTRPGMLAARDDAASTHHPAEETLFHQPLLIAKAATQLAPQRPGHTDVYFLGFAGDGKQTVFGAEVQFARDALARKLDLSGRVLELKNTPTHDPHAPVATNASLRLALKKIGKVMDVDEDILLLFLTSHGSESAKLKVHRPELPLQDLSADALAKALRDSGIKWRIVIISACYSGSFIEALQDEHTLIVTAARADRQSFGCRDNRELTYYGEAFFRDALPNSDSLLSAITLAASTVSQRERAEGFEPSEPQMFMGEKIRMKLPELAFGTG